MTTARAAEIVEEVAGRLADPTQVAKLANAAVWHPMSLNEGYLGVALLHSELGRREEAQAFLSAAAQARPGRHGLVDGLPALLFAARAAASRPGDYGGLLSRAEPAVRALIKQRVEAETTSGAAVRCAAYDVPEGLSGLGRLALAYGDTEPISYLIALTEPIIVDGRPVPGWLVPDGDGHFNLGLAHGISGPLALLALAYREGYRLPEHERAIERIVTWLLGWADGWSWPPAVTLRQQLDGAVPQAPPIRPAWCSGAGGVARALFLAGDALGRPEWRQAAVRALRAAVTRPWDTWGMVDAGLCHGWAGMLHITSRVARESGDTTLLEAADGLARRVVDAFRPQSPFGFEYAATDGAEAAPDRAGLLEGAAGIALALHCHAGGEPPSTGWDAALLLN
ncbi:lanthionine synthetase C family protein [Nonomuraea sp. NPDC046802]|uniref:lanthionine synthetase C family protein n=1 Tax=Nonomuraea sp. NPDC046802 TaxID=3154919 RepID=UPI0033D67D2C